MYLDPLQIPCQTRKRPRMLPASKKTREGLLHCSEFGRTVQILRRSDDQPQFSSPSTLARSAPCLECIVPAEAPTLDKKEAPRRFLRRAPSQRLETEAETLLPPGRSLARTLSLSDTEDPEADAEGDRVCRDMLDHFRALWKHHLEYRR